MHCPSDAELEHFVHDQLPERLDLQIAGHLDSCETCRERADEVSGGYRARVAQTDCGGAFRSTCAEWEEIRTELYELDGADAPTEHAAEILRLLSAEASDPLEGARLGRFAVRRWLGTGGFGVVFLAHDDLLRREVALKLPRAQVLAHREVRERFLREAEAAAQLYHPNIVPLFDAGEEQGICYITSGYCSGPTLDAWLGEQESPVAIDIAVSWTRQLADALQHAHSHRVLHRDIKPSNILLDPSPEDRCAYTPKITDFGLAKLIDDDTRMTGSHGLMGTPRYMAPEQATSGRGTVGPATDIFALGAVFYEMLTGVAPHAAADQPKTLQRLLFEPPTPPRRLRGDLPRDLESICLKCLEKKPERRYRSADELADDLRRFQEGHATRARPIGPTEMLRRWTKRQPLVATSIAIVVLVMLSLLGSFIVYNRSLENLNLRLEAQRTRLGHLLYVATIQQAYRAIQANDLRQGSHLLTEILAETPDVTKDFVWRYLWTQVAAPSQEIDSREAAAYYLQFSPTGSLLAACGADSVLRVYDGTTFAPLQSLSTAQGELNSVAFSPDQQRLATAGDDGSVRIWDVPTWKPVRTIAADDQRAYGVRFTADGRTLVTCGESPEIRLWDVATGKLKKTLRGHQRAVEAIVISPNGKHLASACSDDTARIWDLASGKTLHVLKGHQGRVVDVQYSPNGAHLLTGSIDHTIRLWRAADGKLLQVERHVDEVASVAFTREEDEFVVADRGGSVYLWQRNADQKTQAEDVVMRRRWTAHRGRVWSVIAGRRSGVLTAGADGKIRFWEDSWKPQEATEIEEPREIYDFAFGSGSEQLHLATAAGEVRTWNLGDGRVRGETQGNRGAARTPLAVDMLPNHGLVMVDSDGLVEAIDVPSQRVRFRLTVPLRDGVPLGQVRLETDAAGRRLAVYSRAHDTTWVYDTSQLISLGAFTSFARSMALSPDGRHLAMSDGNDVLIWDVDRQRQIARLRGHTSTVHALQFSHDGRRLASGSNDRYVRLWDVAGQSSSQALQGHRAAVMSLAFSPDGRLLASGDDQGEVKFWLLAEGAELIAIAGTESIRQLGFSPDGTQLAEQRNYQIRLLDSGSAVEASRVRQTDRVE